MSATPERMSRDVTSRSVLDQLAQVTKLIREAHIRSDTHARATHERFNVFTTLLSESDEVRLHTRFLYCLLDPNGRHDCGPLFLNLFFTTLEEMPGVNHEGELARLEIPPSARAWNAYKEVSCPGHGQIDLLLERQDDRFALVIENKIHAVEQPFQLASYAEHLAKHFGTASRVLFLTLDGKASSTHDGKPYIRLSYREHILAWLEKCLRETYHVIPVNQSLQQYRVVVREITGQTLEASAMKTITDFILQNTDILRYSDQIAQSLTEARGRLLTTLAEAIAASIQTHGLGVNGPVVFSGSNYSQFVVTPTPTSILRGAPFEIWLQSDPTLKVLAVGTVAKQPWSREQEAMFKRMDTTMDRLTRERGYYRKNRPAKDWPLGWHNVEKDMSNTALLRLTQTPNEGAQKIGDAVRNYVEMVEIAYREATSLRAP
jgi:hypothetical protein